MIGQDFFSKNSILRFPIRLKVGIGTRLLEVYSIQNSIQSRELDEYFAHFEAYCSTNRFDLWEDEFTRLPSLGSEFLEDKEWGILDEGFACLGTIATEYLFVGFPKDEVVTGKFFIEFLDGLPPINMENNINWNFVEQLDLSLGWGEPFCYSELGA